MSIDKLATKQRNFSEIFRIPNVRDLVGMFKLGTEKPEIECDVLYMSIIL